MQTLLKKFTNILQTFTLQNYGGIHLTIKVTDKKYLINVDFPTESIIHLNPLIHSTGSSCQTGIKIPSDGGIVLATEDEVITYLNGSATLLFNDKKVGNLRKCKLCMQIFLYKLEVNENAISTSDNKSCDQ